MASSLREAGDLEVWKGFDLSLSLYASYTLPWFENPKPRTFIKDYGFKLGLKLVDRRGSLTYSGCTEYEASILSGAWFNPLEHIKAATRKGRSCAQELYGVFPGLGMALNPWDLRAMLYSIFLSRTTDFHMNTVTWMKRLTKSARCEDGLKGLDPRIAGSSYQLSQLAAVKPALDAVVEEVRSKIGPLNAEEVLRLSSVRLLNVPYVGPKTVHAFGLFCLGVMRIAPADRHLLKVSLALGLVEEGVKMPEKRLCVKFNCLSDWNKCPQTNNCLTAVISREFGLLAGWFQTATYLYGCMYLSKGEDPIGILKR